MKRLIESLVVSGLVLTGATALAAVQSFAAPSSCSCNAQQITGLDATAH